MAEKKEKYPIYISPKGVAKWAHLSVAQTMVGEKPVDPNFNVTVLLDPNDATTIEFVEKITKAHSEGLAAAKKAEPKKKLKDEGIGNMIQDDTNKDGEPTGKTAIKFKHKASGVRRDKTEWSFRPALFDGAGVPLAPGTVVYGGSVLQVAYGIKHTVMPTGSFYTSLQLQAVMVSVLKSGFDRDASSYGFQVETAEAQTAFGEEQVGEADGAASTDF